MIDSDVASTIAELHTAPEIETFQREVLAVYLGAAETSVSFGGGSIAVSKENAASLLATLKEAARIKAAASPEEAEVAAEPATSGFSFANRHIQ